MRSSVRSMLVTVASAALMAGLAPHAIAAPAPQGPAASRALASALEATAGAETLAYSAVVAIGDTRVDARGQVDLGNDRTSMDVSVGGASTEFRRIGGDYYIDARRLGASGQPWVLLTGPAKTREMSVRSVRSLVAGLSPETMLDRLSEATSVTRIATDDSGMRFRAVVPGMLATFIPLASAFGDLDSDLNASVDVTVDPRGRVKAMTASTDGFSVRFTLRSFGGEVAIAAPPRLSTGDLRSSSARYLFGAGRMLPASRSMGLQYSPTAELVDGVIQGSLRASSITGQQLRFTFVSGSKGGKLALGNVPVEPNSPTTDPQSFTVLPYADWLDGGTTRGTETFGVRISESTSLDRYMATIPLIGSVAPAVITQLQATPQALGLVASAIGFSAIAVIGIDVATLAPGDTPVAFTRKVPGYRETPISVNFFPASGLTSGSTAPTVLQGSGLATPGNIDPYQVFDADAASAGTQMLRIGPPTLPLNVITWDARGTFASRGVLQLNNPFYEGVDVSRIITWAAENTPALLNGPLDPAVGMVGGSSGGEIQLVAGGTDPRIDAVVPSVTWNSLIDSLQPNGVVDRNAVRKLLAALSGPDIRINSQLRHGLRDAMATGRFSGTTLALLSDKNVATLLNQAQTPALLWQSTVDPLFPANQSTANAQALIANPYGVPTKVAWFSRASGDGVLQQAIIESTLAWLGEYISVVDLSIPVDEILPNFQWWDQAGVRHASELLPFSDGFYGEPVTGTSEGGRLVFRPDQGRATTRISMTIPVDQGAQIVGQPTLAFTYTGKGRARAIVVRITDAETGKPLTGRPYLVPVVLDETSHTVAVALDGIAFTGQESSAVRVDILGRGELPGATGRLRVSDVTANLPRYASRDN